MDAEELIPVVLCGGNGTRLWPMSRESCPKQFLDLLGDGRTMLQHTLQRVQRVPGATTSDCPTIVCHARQRFIVAQQLEDMGLKAPRIVLEPESKSTAPALTLAALMLTRNDETRDPVLLVMPADHAVSNSAAFAAAVLVAHREALAGALVTIGVRPTRPETAYGYIRAAAAEAGPSRNVREFIEKPAEATARRCMESGAYFWNCGIFVMRASVWLRAVAACQPEVHRACAEAVERAQCDSDFVRPDAAAFARSPSISIDYGVMERLPAEPSLGILVKVVPFDGEWSDLGSWDAIRQHLPHDASGNAVVGHAAHLDCRDVLLMSNGRLIAAAGLTDVIVVETPDAVLAVARSSVQDVKQLVETLRSTGHKAADTHRQIFRPWGSYDCLESGERFHVKKITVKPGGSLSLQMHYHRAEHWIVVKGTAEITTGESRRLLHENESTYIPAGQVHRLANPGKLPLQLIEVQSGSYLEEDDIVRLDDRHGRS